MLGEPPLSGFMMENKTGQRDIPRYYKVCQILDGQNLGCVIHRWMTIDLSSVNLKEYLKFVLIMSFFQDYLQVFRHQTQIPRPAAVGSRAELRARGGRWKFVG